MRRVMSLTVLVAAVLLTGCGRTLQTPPPLQQVTPGATAPGYAYDPGYNSGYPGSGNGYNPYPGYNSDYPGYGSNPYDPTNGNITAPLTAKIDNQKNGAILGLGTFVVNVSVSNPSSNPQQGRLKVSIMNNGESIRDFTEVVTVPAGQSISRSYSDKRWSADNAVVSVQTLGASDPYSTGGYNVGNGYDQSGYNQGGYGSGSYGDGYNQGGYGSGSYGSGYPSNGYGY